MRPFRVLAFAIFAVAVPAAIAQSYTAAKISFNHPGGYSQAQLEAAAGMHKGTTFTADELGAAAQRLVDTGFFDNVGATLAPGRGDAITVLFDIQPTDQTQMLHVRYENFVWLSHDEIEAALQTKSPLFEDYLPENSPLQDVFNDALKDALTKKGVTARVTHDTIEPTMLRPERSIDFWIDSPAIRVANVKLSGVASELAPLVQKSVNAAAKAPYSEETADILLTPLMDAGYARAALSDIALTPAVGDTGATVVVAATLNAGDVYRVSGITFAGTALLSADAFAATEKLRAGDVAARALLLETLAPLDAAYRRQGYMDVSVKAEPSFDETKHEVAYTVSVTPGEQYRIKQVTTHNLDSAAQADFDRGFTMKAGELYNPEYVTGFLKNNTALRALAGYTAGFKAYADPNTHMVDLVLSFARGAR